MEIKIKYIILLLFLGFSTCSSYTEIDKLYTQGEFEQAYNLLKNKNINTRKYKEYELKLVMQIVMSGNKDFLPLLDALLLQSPPEQMHVWQDLARAWIRFISAQNNEDFRAVLEILPDFVFKDQSFERIRLAMQTHALTKLGRYQEVIFNLEGKKNIMQKNSELLYLQGNAYQHMADDQKALNSFNEASKLSQNAMLKALANFKMAEIYERNNDRIQAQKNYLVSWELQPYNAELNFRLGKLLSQQEYEGLHQRFYRAALRLDENNAEAWYYLNLQ